MRVGGVETRRNCRKVILLMSSNGRFQVPNYVVRILVIAVMLNLSFVTWLAVKSMSNPWPLIGWSTVSMAVLVGFVPQHADK